MRAGGQSGSGPRCAQRFSACCLPLVAFQIYFWPPSSFPSVNVIIVWGDWVQLKRGTIETKIKKGVRYLLVVLKKSPIEYHMEKQLCVKFGWNRLRSSAAIDVFVFLGLFVNASGAVKKRISDRIWRQLKIGNIQIVRIFLLFRSVTNLL